MLTESTGYDDLSEINILNQPSKTHQLEFKVKRNYVHKYSLSSSIKSEHKRLVRPNPVNTPD